MKISENKLVTLRYKLYVKTQQRIGTYGKTTEKEPLRFSTEWE